MEKEEKHFRKEDFEYFLKISQKYYRHQQYMVFKVFKNGPSKICGR